MNLQRLIPAAAVAAAVAGCRTDKAILNDYEANISAGNYGSPVAEVTAKADEGGRSEQMWRLLAASANYMADDKVAAVAQFDKAERVFERNDRTSVFAQGGDGAMAMIMNDKSFAYDGGGLDREFTCVYRAIDFMASGQNDLARVELNRAMQYQTNWLEDRRREIASAEDRLRNDAAEYERQQNSKSTGRGTAVNKALADASFTGQIREKCAFDAATSGNLARLSAKDYMNAYALHLTGLFRWLNGDSDRNELKEAVEFGCGSPVALRDYTEQSRSMRPRNQVWIYVEDGLCPCREEWRLDLPLAFIPFLGRYVKYAGMALPYLRYRNAGASAWMVSDRVKPPQQMAHLANVDGLVKTEFDVYFRGALKREITRTIVKVGAQVALGIAADNTKDNGKKLALELSQLGVASWAMSVTAADLRSWTALPKSVRLHRMDRPENGRIFVQADNQPIEITVPEGNTIVFIRKPAPAALPVVKCATFRN